MQVYHGLGLRDGVGGAGGGGFEVQQCHVFTDAFCNYPKIFASFHTK